MALPMNATPVYTLQVPSTKKEFKYRPFLVKDEKALLVAQQSEDTTVMLDTIKSVIASCAKSDVDVDKLATFDIEYIFTQMRAVSVGELVELIFACDDCTTEEARVKLLLNLQNMKVVVDPDHTPNIKLFDEVGVMMKYPTIDTLKKIENSDVNDMEQMEDLIVDCISYIYDGDEVFHAHEQTPEELVEFINNLTSEQYQKIQQFFRTMPVLRQDVNYTCPVCNKQHNKYLEGLSSFF
jgi:hypothetical protein